MRRAFRVSVGGLALVSLALAIGIAAIWARSHFADESVTYRTRRTVGIASDSVAFKLEWNRGDAILMRQQVVRLLPERGGEAAATLPRLGWRYERARSSASWQMRVPDVVWNDPVGTPMQSFSPIGHRVLYTPLAYPFAAASAAPLAWLASVILRTRRCRRRSAGRCDACGYDLRESRDRCPECGTVAAHASR